MPRLLPLLAVLVSTAAVRVLAADPVLTVTAPGRTLVFAAGDLGGLAHVEVQATDPHEKVTHRYSGVPVHDLLASVGAPFGDKMHGQALQLAVIVRSADGYAVLYALPEFDPAFSDRTIIIADKEDGAPLPAKAGPLRLIAPGDKHAARWPRMVTSIELVQPLAAAAAKR